MYVPRNQQAAKKLIPAMCTTHTHTHTQILAFAKLHLPFPHPRQRRASLGKACATCTCHNPFAVQDSPFVQLGRCALGTNFPQLQSFSKNIFLLFASISVCCCFFCIKFSMELKLIFLRRKFIFVEDYFI